MSTEDRPEDRGDEEEGRERIHGIIQEPVLYQATDGDGGALDCEAEDCNLRRGQVEVDDVLGGMGYIVYRSRADGGNV